LTLHAGSRLQSDLGAAAPKGTKIVAQLSVDNMHRGHRGEDIADAK